MINANFEFISNLQYKVKNLGIRVQAFESGEKYTTMQSAFKAQLSTKDREIRKLKLELANAHAQLITMRNNWTQVFDDLEEEQTRELAKKEREKKALEERALNAEEHLDVLRVKLKEKTLELYQTQTELEEERGRNQKLTAQINRDYETPPSRHRRNPITRKLSTTVRRREESPVDNPDIKGIQGRGIRRRTGSIYLCQRNM